MVFLKLNSILSPLMFFFFFWYSEYLLLKFILFKVLEEVRAILHPAVFHLYVDFLLSYAYISVTSTYFTVLEYLPIAL